MCRVESEILTKIESAEKRDNMCWTTMSDRMYRIILLP